MSTKEQRGLAMSMLSNHISPERQEAIKFAESVICTIFRYDTRYGTEKCFSLRKTLVDLWDQAQEGRTT